MINYLSKEKIIRRTNNCSFQKSVHLPNDKLKLSRKWFLWTAAPAFCTFILIPAFIVGIQAAFRRLQILRQSLKFEPHHDKTNKVASAPSEDSDQPGHLPRLIRVFAVRMKKAWVLIYSLSAQRRLWSDWADAQVDLPSLGAQSFCWFCHDAALMFRENDVFMFFNKKQHKNLCSDTHLV